MGPRLRSPALGIAFASTLAACGGGAAAGPPRYHGVVEIQEVHVGSKIGGRVAETLAVEGALLKAGDPLARFEVPELDVRRLAAEARLREAEADLERARNGPRAEERAAAKAASETSRARLALLEAGARPEEVAAARADLAAAEADLVFAEKDLERDERLLAEKTISSTERDASRAARDRARGRRDSVRARVDLLLAGSRKEDVAAAAAEVRRMEAGEALLLAGTRAEEITAAAARAQRAGADLKAVEVDLAESVVRAPEDSVLEVLAVRRGDLLAPGAPVARLHRIADLWVKVYVPETEIGGVKVGGGAEVTVDSFPGKRFAGKVSWIAAEAEFTPRNVQSADERRHQVFAVRIVVDDPAGVFKSGMAADAVLAGEPSAR